MSATTGRAVVVPPKSNVPVYPPAMITSPLPSMVTDSQIWSPAPPNCLPQTGMPVEASIFATRMSMPPPALALPPVITPIEEALVFQAETFLLVFPHRATAFWTGLEPTPLSEP